MVRKETRKKASITHHPPPQHKEAFLEIFLKICAIPKAGNKSATSGRKHFFIVHDLFVPGFKTFRFARKPAIPNALLIDFAIFPTSRSQYHLSLEIFEVFIIELASNSMCARRRRKAEEAGNSTTFSSINSITFLMREMFSEGELFSCLTHKSSPNET